MCCRCIFGGLYCCAKFGWNQCSSFDDMNIYMFSVLGLKHLSFFFFFLSYLWEMRALGHGAPLIRFLYFGTIYIVSFCVCVLLHHLYCVGARCTYLCL